MNAVGADSRLAFVALSIVPEGDEFLVGNAAAGTFVSLPEVGVVALRALAGGKTVAMAGLAAAAHAGEDVNTLEFADALVELGFVTAIDDVPVRADDAPAEQAWLERIRPEVARPFFSRVAWSVYAAAAAFAATTLAVVPELRPTFEDFFFYPDPAVAMVAILASRIVLGAIHELWHFLAARAAGIGARLCVSRRLFLPVFEADLSQLWGLPRGSRYGPFLAGMAFDSVVLATCLGLRLAWTQGLVDLPPLLLRFLGAVVLVLVTTMVLQALVFLRTDLYAVLTTALGCRNLYRVNLLVVRRALRRASASELGELAQAHPRDLRTARWFSLVYAAGIALAAVVFVGVFIPGTVVLAGWMFHSMRGVGFGTPAFWEALVIALTCLFRIAAPVAVLVWERSR